MYEKRNQPLLSSKAFAARLFRNVIVGLLAIIMAVFVGMLGYHHYENFSWVDSFLNASMILSGMGEINTLMTQGGKIFAGFYALFSGLAFILIVGIIFAPLVHRIFHKFHLKDE